LGYNRVYNCNGSDDDRAELRDIMEDTLETYIKRSDVIKILGRLGSYSKLDESDINAMGYQFKSWEAGFAEAIEVAFEEIDDLNSVIIPS